MKSNEINIRDPFVLFEDGVYYLYGTRAANFGRCTGGFDVYTSTDLENWSDKKECFNSVFFNMNKGDNWAPEVHKSCGKYYMFASFTMENGRHGTYALVSDSPLGPFVPHSKGALTPQDWECIDGTLHEENGEKYLVFVHEHTQITDGTICFLKLNDDMTKAVSQPTLLFSASSSGYSDKLPGLENFVTDGPFMHRTENGRLLMIWSTFIKGKYAQCVVRFLQPSIHSQFEHLAPLVDNDGGHGMIFRSGRGLFFAYHSPNTCAEERPVFAQITETEDSIAFV